MFGNTFFDHNPAIFKQISVEFCREDLETIIYLLDIEFQSGNPKYDTVHLWVTFGGKIGVVSGILNKTKKKAHLLDFSDQLLS